MTGRPAGQLARSLGTLTIGVAQDQRFRDRVLTDSYMGEFEQQVQLQVSGTAGNGWGHEDVKVRFELPFYYAPTQRMVPFDRPHFTYGFELLHVTAPKKYPLIHLGATIIKWNVNNSGWIVGATVRVSAVAPSVTGDPYPFKAVAHLAFQGYAAATDGDNVQQ